MPGEARLQCSQGLSVHYVPLIGAVSCGGQASVGLAMLYGYTSSDSLTYAELYEKCTRWDTDRLQRAP
jgi:hypothetical protein